MFRAGSEEVVSIGTASKRRCDRLDATLSRVGGIASFHSVSQKPSLLKCRRCQKSDGIVLVTQLFAPFTVDRSVYVFACTHPGCAATAEAWIALRNQATATEQDTISASPLKAELVAPVAKSASVSPVKGASTSVWSFDADTNAEDGEDNIDNLLSMLEVRDNALLAPKLDAAVKTPNAKSVSAVEKNLASIDESRLLRTSKQLPCYEIEDFDEGWDTSLENTEDDDVMSNVDQGHITRLIETYLRDEEDREYAAQLQQQLSTANSRRDVVDEKHNDDDSSLHSDDEIDGNEDDDDDDVEVDKEKKPQKGKLAASAATSAGRKPVASSQSSRSMQQAERYFQRRVSRHPSQILRYASTGMPLWSSAEPPLVPSRGTTPARPSSSSSSSGFPPRIPIPACPHCGRDRVFEFQLMPGMLALWPSCAQLPMHRLPASNARNSNSQLNSSSMELDFGVIAVYTCPESCSLPEGQVPFEYLLVQPSADMI